MQERINALGDIALLIDKYFQDNAAQIQPNDGWNPAGFTVEHIETDWGWYFQTLAKPTIDDLEAIYAELNP